MGSGLSVVMSLQAQSVAAAAAAAPSSSSSAPSSSSSSSVLLKHSVRTKAMLMCLLSLMSDASCMSLQGIYGADIVQSYISLETVTPEAQDDEIIDFYPHCVSPLFNYQAGALSPYGDELLSFLHAVCTKKGLLVVLPLDLLVMSLSCALFCWFRVRRC
jgi:hypothetical protein